MQFYIIILTSFLSLTASALPSSEPAANVLAARQNANRPVPTGACCVSNTSLKQDVCNVNGQTGRCVPAGVNNCGDRLTCIEDNRLTCDPNTLERGRPRCRLAAGA